MITMNNTVDTVQDETTKGDLKLVQRLGMNSRQEAALLQIGFRFYQQGRFADAKNIFEGLALLDETNAYVHGILGSLYQREGKDEAAISSYNAAILLFDNDVDSHVNRGELFLKLGKFQEAAEDFATAIHLDPPRKNRASNRARLLVAITQDALKLGKEKGIEAVQQERNRLKQTQGRR
jgi:tetratricopeptide (TPR) repeat protein